jgi:tryptophanyl-tRNA synthetase
MRCNICDYLEYQFTNKHKVKRRFFKDKFRSGEFICSKCKDQVDEVRREWYQSDEAKETADLLKELNLSEEREDYYHD